MFFSNDLTKELLLCHAGIWYKLPMSSGLAGYCAETGDCLNIQDAYADHRFNR